MSVKCLFILFCHIIGKNHGLPGLLVDELSILAPIVSSFCVELVMCHPSGSWSLEVIPTLLENLYISDITCNTIKTYLHHIFSEIIFPWCSH
jgi:hypothetical protein